MIKTIQEHRLRSGEYLQFMSDVVSICGKANTEALGIKAQYDGLGVSVSNLQTGFGKDRKSDITDELVEIDQRRDNCIVGILSIAEAYMLHYNPAHAALAKLLVNKIDSFGTRIAKQNYQTETSIITNLCVAFVDEPDVAKALSTLHITSWANKLKAENILFAERFIDRINEAAQDNEEKFKAMREKVTANYRTLTNHLVAHITLKGETDYLSIVAPLNELVDSYNLLIKRRTSDNNDNQA